MAVPPDDAAALADAVCALVDDEPRASAMGEAARALAVERYSWPAIARASRRCYAERHGLAQSRGARRMTVVTRVWESGLGAGRRRRRRLRRRRDAALVARPGLGKRLRRASSSSIWSWIVLALLLNVVSTLFRALSWRLTIGQALPPEHQPRLVHVLSSFGVGLLANAIVPGRLGELARVATLRRHLPDAPPGTSATLVGTVFAHRLFDLVPATILVVWVLLTAEVPHWAVVVVHASRPRSASPSSRSPGSAPSGTTGRS